jgi:hypothetical protein
VIRLALVLAGILGSPSADEPQGKPPAPDSDRPTISAAEVKALRELNIFAPLSVAGRPPRKASVGVTESVPSKPKPPVVTGIFLDPKTKTYQLIVEDRNDATRRQFKTPKFLKAGEVWCKLVVESVSEMEAVCKMDGDSRTLTVGSALPDGDWKFALSGRSSEEIPDEDGDAPAPAPGPAPKVEGKAETAPPSTADRSRTLEEMKRRNGKKSRPKDTED